MNKDAIIAALPKLKPAELAEVQVALKMLGAFQGAPKLSSPAGVDWLLSGIAAYLHGLGLVGKDATFDLQRRTAFQQYKAKAPDVLAYLRKLMAENSIGVRHQTQMAFLCARSLRDMMEARNYFSVGAMLSQVDKIPEALDMAYPGYIAGGHFGFIFKHTMEGKTE